MSVTIPGVDLAAAGTWDLSSGRATFTRDDLEAAIAASKCPAVGNPVIKLGHVDPRFDGEPALGSVKNLRTDASGNKLVGDLTGLPNWLGEVMASAYPNRSIEGAQGYRCTIGHTHQFVLTGLALLGITPPGVGVLNSLPDVQQMLTASKGAQMDAQRVLSAHREIMIAAGRGVISPANALRYARRAAAGEDVSHLAMLSGESREFRQEFDATPRLSEDVMGVLSGRQVTAHSNQQALQQAHDALDRGHPGAYQPDEFEALFNPSSPLGPDDDDTGAGHYTPPTKPAVQQSASAYEPPLTDAELFKAMYGYNPPAGYFEGD